MFEFNGQGFNLGDKVIYSVYPEVWRGTGVIDEEDGVGAVVRSTGETLERMNAGEIADYCEVEGLYDIEHDNS